jgi:hypothetical protein
MSNLQETCQRLLAEPQEPDGLSKFKPEHQEQLRQWLADGTFVERALGTMWEQENELSQPKAELEATCANCGDVLAGSKIDGAICCDCAYRPKAEPQSGIKQVVELYDSPEHEPAAVKAAWLAGYTEGQKDAWAEPQPRRRLTDEEIDAIYIDHRGDGGPTAMCEQFARAIEAAVWKEKT